MVIIFDVDLVLMVGGIVLSSQSLHVTLKWMVAIYLSIIVNQKYRYDSSSLNCLLCYYLLVYLYYTFNHWITSFIFIVRTIEKGETIDVPPC